MEPSAYSAFLRECGVDPGRLGHLDLLARLHADLRAANERTNLTRITGEWDFWNLHVADCLLVGRAAPDVMTEPLRVADAGCGAGFPLIPLAWANPRLEAVGFESRRRKADFVRAEAAALGLPNCRVVARRVREAARLAEHAGAYDVVVARAVGTAAELVRECRGLLRPGAGSRLILYKTPNAVSAEWPLAEREAAKHGLHVGTSEMLHLPGGEPRTFLVISR